LLRSPFWLLLTWASLINVAMGSSLTLFQGNHLDLVLIVSLLGLLPFLPWQELYARFSGWRWLALYLLWALLGVGLSPLMPRAALTLWLSMVASAATGALVVALVTSRRRLRALITMLLGTGLLVALYAGLNSVTHQRGEIDQGTSLWRVTSFFTQATTLAFYLTPLIPLALYRACYAQGRARLLWLLVAGALTWALLLTFTRSALLGLFLGMAIFILCLPWSRARRMLLAGSWLGVGALALALGGSGHLPLLGRFFQGDVATLNGRVYLWQALLRIFQITRWLGSGLQASDQVLSYLRVGEAGQGVIGWLPIASFWARSMIRGLSDCFCCCSFSWLWALVWSRVLSRMLVRGGFSMAWLWRPLSA